MAAIIFDFDGTIADSFETVVKILYELTGHDRPLPDKEVERLRGLTPLRAAEELHVHPWKVPFLLMRGRRRMSRRIRGVKAHPGIPEVIRKLYDEGHQLFVVSSNSRKNIRLFLRQHNLAKEFVNLYGGAGLFGKTRLLKRVLRRNNLDTENTWYVGDEVRDIIAAQHAGLRVVAVTWGFNSANILRQHHPTKAVETPAELLSVLEEI